MSQTQGPTRSTADAQPGVATAGSPLPAGVGVGYTRARLAIAGRSLPLDGGGLHVLRWPDDEAMRAELARLHEYAAPLVRTAGGAPIADLTLRDNLLLEPALTATAADVPAALALLPEIDALFARLGRPLDWPAWSRDLPHEADALMLAQLRVGRALVADPDLLVIDADEWDDDLLAPAAFSAAFAARFPWRVLAWGTHDARRATALRASLAGLTDPGSIATPDDPALSEIA